MKQQINRGETLRKAVVLKLDTAAAGTHRWLSWIDRPPLDLGEEKERLLRSGHGMQRSFVSPHLGGIDRMDKCKSQIEILHSSTTVTQKLPEEADVLIQTALSSWIGVR